jgi:hypothetical protein
MYKKKGTKVDQISACYQLDKIRIYKTVNIKALLAINAGSHTELRFYYSKKKHNISENFLNL